MPTIAPIHYIIVNGENGGIPQEFVDKARMVTEAHFKSLAMAREAGVLIGMGTDAGTPYNLHGQNGNEMELMVRGGPGPRRSPWSRPPARLPASWGCRMSSAPSKKAKLPIWWWLTETRCKT